MITTENKTRITKALGERCDNFIVKKANEKDMKNLKGGKVSYQTVHRLLKGETNHPELEIFIMELVKKVEVL